MDVRDNPYTSPVTAEPPFNVENLGKRATRAVVCGVIGVLLFPPLGVAAWVYGRDVLRSIKLNDAGHEHRAAAQMGVLAGFFALAWFLIRVLIWLNQG